VHAPTCFPLERVVPPEGAEISGYSLPGGTVIGTMAPLMNKNKEVFGNDVDAFRPERWLNQDPEQLKIIERTFFTVSLNFSWNYPWL
jgi:cytochrome P450